MKNLGNLNAKGNDRQSQLEDEVAELRERLRMVPSTFAGASDVDRPSIYIVEGGQTLTNFATPGIVKEATTLDGTTLPPGVGGSPGDTVPVSPWPIPASLPNGVGVGRLYGTAGRAFLLLDGSAAWQEDLILNQQAWTFESVILTRVSGGINYTYSCQRVFAGF